MTRILVGLAGLIILAGVVAATFAVAQDDEKSRFVRFVERQISTEDRKISLGTIEGALSSDVRISQITIADRRGVWLTIEGAELVWSRLALLRGRLSIDSLKADAVRITRRPLPAESDEPLEEGSEFTLPDLPVAIRIDSLDIGEVELSEDVIGEAARLKVTGAATLNSDELDVTFDIDRLDEPGTFSIAAAFESGSRELSIDVAISEPEDGVLANALKIEGRPALTFTIKGEGPLSQFRADLSLTANDETLLSGVTEILGDGDSLRFIADLQGNIAPLVADLYDPLVDGGTELAFDASRAGDGTFTISEGAFKSGAAALTFSGSFAPDGIPTQLAINGRLARADNAPVALPGGSGDATIQSADIDVSLGTSADGTFSASIEFSDLESPFITAPTASLNATGRAENLGDPASRAVTFSVIGRASGLGSDVGGVADALGSALALDVDGAWRTGAPVTIDNASLRTETASARFAGEIGDGLSGRYALATPSLAAFSALANQTLSGAIDLTADGTIGFAGLFDLTLNATGEDLSFGIDAPDGLLRGTTTITGSAAREESGVSFRNFSLQNPQLSLTVDGAVLPDRANLLADLSLADLGNVDEKLAGALKARLNIAGNPQNPGIIAELSSDEIDIGGQPLTNLDLSFDGTLDRASDTTADVDGRLSVEGRFANEPIRISAQLETTDGARILRNLTAEITDARALGSVAVRDGLVSGDLNLNVPELRRLAALALLEATGTIEADVALRAGDGTQTVGLTGTVRELNAFGTSLGFASADLTVNDVFGVPVLDGEADLRALSVGGFDVRTAKLFARKDGDSATDLTLTADFGAGNLDLEGRLARLAEGFEATVRRFSLEGSGQSATLQAPARVTVTDSISVDEARLAVGSGSVTLGGEIGETLNFTADIAMLPLSIANLIDPKFGIEGTVDGKLTATGTRLAPDVVADVEARGVTAAALRTRGIDPVDITADGRFRDGTLSLNDLRTTIGSGSLTASGTAGETFDFLVNAEALPLALANAFAPDLEISGTLSGNAEIEGTLDDPRATFSLSAPNVSAKALRDAGLGSVAASAEGTFGDNTVSLTNAGVTIGDGSITATGTAGDRLDLTVTLTDVPLALANAADPSLGVAGALSGTAQVTGRPARPSVVFDLSSPSVSTAATRAAGLPAGSLRVAGEFEGGTVQLNEAVIAIGGGEARARGRAGRTIDLTVDLTSLPLSLANSASPELGLAGSLSGTVRATGSANAPAASFELSVAGFSAAQLASAGVSGITVNASGNFANNAVRLASLTASGVGLEARVSGNLPLSGGGLALDVEARAPLSLANRFLAERGSTLDGSAVVSARVTGSLASPSVAGNINATDITFRDPQSSLVLQDGRLDASLSGSQAVINDLTASLGGGTVSVSGTIGLAGAFPANLTIALRDARYADGELFSVTLGGDLTVTGPLTGSPLIAGNILIDRAEIQVPENFAGSGPLIDVKHIGAPPDVLETLRRARVGPFAETEDGGTGASGVTLDITIDAPARIFIRGRGIDAEFGGQLRVTGPVSNVSPVGRFELIRGRLVILGQRIVFTEGAVTLLGDLNPAIRLVAETRANSVTVRVVIDGPADDPDVTFESEPELPQDEVLSQLLFGRSLSDLSAFQVAQLAAAVAELAGAGSGPGILEQIRVFIGLDNLEIVTEDDGSTAVEAGSYIADNIYLGVRGGNEGGGVTVNLDITRELKLRAEALTNETSIGVFYEHEY